MKTFVYEIDGGHAILTLAGPIEGKGIASIQYVGNVPASARDQFEQAVKNATKFSTIYKDGSMIH